MRTRLSVPYYLYIIIESIPRVRMIWKSPPHYTLHSRWIWPDFRLELFRIGVTVNKLATGPPKSSISPTGPAIKICKWKQSQTKRPMLREKTTPTVSTLTSRLSLLQMKRWSRDRIGATYDGKERSGRTPDTLCINQAYSVC